MKRKWCWKSGNSVRRIYDCHDPSKYSENERLQGGSPQITEYKSNKYKTAWQEAICQAVFVDH